MKFSHAKFFEGYKRDFDSSLDQSQVDGLEFLLSSFEADSHWKDLRHIAYALATVYHECAGSWQPVVEGYYLAKTTPPDYQGKTKRVKDFHKTLRYHPFIGAGYVQLTWKKNYQKASKALGIDFVSNPELLLEPENSFQILTRGMHEGWFTGKKLSDYINDSKCDYVNARKIINGLDKAAMIARYAKDFESILRASKVSAAAQISNLQDNPEVNPAGNTSDNTQNGQPPDKAVETSKTFTDESGGKTVEQSVETKNEQDVNQPGEVTEPKPQGLKAKLAALFSTLFGGSLIYTALEKFGGMSLSMQSIIVICFIIFLGFLGFCLWAILDTWKKNARVRIEAEANTSIDRKNIKWVKPE